VRHPQQRSDSPRVTHGHGIGANELIVILSVLNFLSRFLNQFRRWQPTSGPYRSSVPPVTLGTKPMLSSHGKAYKKAKKNFNLNFKRDVASLH
jgi:hypothetical protein